MIDVKNGKKFLKRNPAPKHIVKEDFFIGATVLLFSRELVIVDYGDGTTRSQLHHQSQQSVIILPAENQANWGKIIHAILSAGLLLVRAKSVIIPSDVADRASDILKMNSRSGSETLKSMFGCLVVCVQGEDGVEKLLEIAASFDTGAHNANGDGASLFVATTGIQGQDLKLLLLDGDRHLSSTVTLDNCTCAIIKPHAVKSKLSGRYYICVCVAVCVSVCICMRRACLYCLCVCACVT